MNSQSHEDTALQSSATELEASENNLPSDGLHGFMMRHMGHQGVAHSNTNSTKAVPIIGILLLIMVAIHIVAAIFLAKTGSTGFSFNNPLTYGILGLFAVFMLVKLRHVIGALRGRGKQSALEIADIVPTTNSAQHK